jgi:hypothetical protein
MKNSSMASLPLKNKRQHHHTAIQLTNAIDPRTHLASSTDAPCCPQFAGRTTPAVMQRTHKALRKLYHAWLTFVSACPGTRSGLFTR